MVIKLVLTICNALFGDNKAYIRVNSTSVRMERTIDFFKDAPVILDDLNRETDKKKKRENESHIKNAIRNESDNVGRSTSRSSYQNNAQIAIAAEYYSGLRKGRYTP